MWTRYLGISTILILVSGFGCLDISTNLIVYSCLMLNMLGKIIIDYFPISEKKMLELLVGSSIFIIGHR